MARFSRSQAQYSESGDIVISSTHRAGFDISKIFSWLPSVKKRIFSWKKKAGDEYAHTATGGKGLYSSLKDECKAISASFWKLAKQPVWVTNKNKKTKEYTRGQLFVLDVFRFGCTFAVIFGSLFIVLNYQSFAEQVLPRLSPLQYAHSVVTLESSIEDTFSENLTSAVQKKQGEMLSFLPTVGPPDNRIIIPKLKLNVPVVTPEFDALLREDWVQVEEDIQTALKSGVVHYPGTARPGQAGNFFVTGHSSYYPWAPGKYKTVFSRLHELDVGDEYWVYYNGDRHRYVISERKEVKPTNVSVLDQPVHERISTLMTCTPTGTTLRRLILVADEVDPETGHVLKLGEKGTRETIRYRPESLPI